MMALDKGFSYQSQNVSIRGGIIIGDAASQLVFRKVCLSSIVERLGLWGTLAVPPG